MSKAKAPGISAPVFVFGALRSGTTVFRLMLDAHPGISNPGEVDFLFDYLIGDDSDGWHYDLEGLCGDRIFLNRSLKIPADKNGLELLDSFLLQLGEKAPGVLTLNVHRHVGRIVAAVPEARFIHLVRDPRDVARSSIGMGWAGNLYYGVDHWIRTEQAWDAASASLRPENVITMKYEDLISNLEPELRRVCKFLGLPYDHMMPSYHKGTTYEPPDESLIEQWRRKSSPHEIALVEGKAAAAMIVRDYAPATQGLHPGLAEKIRLFLSNKLHIWRIGARRYGLIVYFSEKVTRKLKLTNLNQRLREIIRMRSARYLK